VLEEDVAEAVAELKRQEGGNIAVLGSGELVRALLAYDLVDEFFLVVFPLVLGSGKAAIRRGRPADQAFARHLQADRHRRRDARVSPR
jgi:dihydrofolate reductase